MSYQENQLFEKISKKLDVLISILLRLLINDKDFTGKRKKGTGKLANYLSKSGLEYKDISVILNAPIGSVRELISRQRRKK